MIDYNEIVMYGSIVLPYVVREVRGGLYGSAISSRTLKLISHHNRNLVPNIPPLILLPATKNQRPQRQIPRSHRQFYY